MLLLQNFGFHTQQDFPDTPTPKTSDFNPTFQLQFAVLNKVIVLTFTIKTALSGQTI